MGYQHYSIVFGERSLPDVWINPDCFLEQLTQIIHEKFNLVPVHFWWEEVYKEKRGISLREVDSYLGERYLAHVDPDNRTIEIVGTTKNCVTWLNSKYSKEQTPTGFYAALLETLEEVEDLIAIVPYWDTKIVYETDKYQVLIDSDGYLYLIDKTM